ncbi:hypothetical protein FNV43_RR24711 [Rhamnella rubrinervis]|uniref:Cucumisin n=1 Tax=Rhamnella rubrinervis TaxID=2594499 RepID=A0A8K0DT37_9ROSA|nr:hypothetical protein FNV43_RR24711 [Rhamnella rubrinervis]
MGELPKGEVSTSHIHLDMLQNVIDSNSSIAPAGSLIYSYQRSFNGFAAKLTKEEADQIAGMKGVVSVFPNQKLKLHTTKSWDFIGFPLNVKRSNVESDIIVGVVDSGIWPESESFSDKGFGPPPAKWKGTCQVSADFKYGHGTHTASTVAGDVVSKASFAGLGTGTARGGVPSARIAVYKVCWSNRCDDADILKAFDDAIADGVDIISASTTVTSFEPWSLSTAASTTNRRFSTKFRLGNGQIYEGIGVNPFDLKNQSFPLISSLCEPNSLDEKLVKGKIVYCESRSDGQKLASAGVAGMIIKGARVGEVPSSVTLASSLTDLYAASKVFIYVNDSSVNKKTATIFKSNEANNLLSPYVPSFSSRGPNPITPNILKPDLSAPGVYILAAYSPIASDLAIKGLKFSIISGTSMACPDATLRMEGYDTERVQQISGSKDFKCSKANSLAVGDLNYPSFALSIPPSDTFSRVYRRIVTNVGSPKSTYTAKVVAPKGLRIAVQPSVLSLTSIAVIRYREARRENRSIYGFCFFDVGFGGPLVVAPKLEKDSEEDPVEDSEVDSKGSDDYVPFGYSPKPVDPVDFDPWDDYK